MMLGAMPLGGLGRGTRSVTYDIPAASAAQNAGGHALSPVLAMREAELAAACCTATARFRVSGNVAGHHRKGTTTSIPSSQVRVGIAA